MTTFSSTVESVRVKLPSEALATQCRQGECCLRIGDELDPFLIVDVDALAAIEATQRDTRCDYVFVGGDPSEAWIVPIELTAGQLRVEKTVKQVRAGAKLANRLVPLGEEVRFRPVAAYRYAKKYVFQEFKMNENQIRFRDKSVAIRLAKCGDSLRSKLS